MNKIEEVQSQKNYKDLFLKSEESFLQSWEWGEVKRHESWSPLRLNVWGLPLQVLLKKLPFSSVHFAYIARGFRADWVTPEILTDICDFLSNKSISHILVDPNISDPQFEKFFADSGFINSGLSVQPNFTNIIDLSFGIEEVGRKMKPQFRRDTRKALELGVCVEGYRDGGDVLNRFYNIMQSIFARTQFIMHGFDYFQTVWHELTKSDMAKIYIANKGGVDIGGIFVAFDRYGAYELYGGLTEDGKKLRIGPLLRVEAFRDIINLGKKFYDQWGVASFDELGFRKDHELYGISVFKQGMGGVNIKFLNQRTRVFSSFYYGYFRMLRYLNGCLIKLKKLMRQGVNKN